MQGGDMLRRLIIAFALALLLSLIAASSAAAEARDLPHNPVIGPTDLCLPAILIAVVTEGAALYVLARVRGKPTRPLLLACALVNVVTVTALAIATSSALLSSLTTLITAEIVICLLEAAFLLLFPGTSLTWKEGLVFSTVMNATSLLAGLAITLAY